MAATPVPKVAFIDANSTPPEMTTNIHGDFHTQDSIPTPYHAAIFHIGRNRIMIGAQTDCNCANCHTQSGANGAPNRIYLP